MEIDYYPPGPVADAFMCSDAFVRGIRGPIGSGKSTACVMEMVYRARQQAPGPDGKRRTRWAVIRNTFPELKTTTIATWHQWVPRTHGKWLDQGPPSHRVSIGDAEMEVMFLALDTPDDTSKLLSLELTGAWINEAREVPRAIPDALTGRVGRYPPARDGGCTWSGVLMDTNSPDTDHWWYRLAEEQSHEGFAFFAQPSGLDPGAENLDWLNQTPETLILPPGHPDRRKQGRGYYERVAAGKDDAWTKVYVRGEYGFIVDGRPVYPEYRDGLHCREFELRPGLPIHVGLDFGLTPAAVIGQRQPNGQWRWRHELVSEDMGITRFGELLGRELRGRYDGYTIERITGDPAGEARAQTDERTVYDVLRGMKIDAFPAPTNDFAMRREAVAGPLSRLVDGEPALLIHPDCRVLRKAMSGGYSYRRIAVAGQERFRDVPDKTTFSHVAEAGQYLMLGAGEGHTVLGRSNRGARVVVAKTDWNAFGDDNDQRREERQRPYDPFAGLE